MDEAIKLLDRIAFDRTYPEREISMQILIDFIWGKETK